MTNTIKSYAKKATATKIAATLTANGEPHEVKQKGNQWSVVPVEAAAVITEEVPQDTNTDGAIITTNEDGQPVINPDLTGTEDTPDEPVEQSLAAPSTDTSAQALVTFMVQPAKITTDYVIVKAGPLGKERWFQRARLHSATKVDNASVTIVCTRAELISRGLKELAATAPIFNVEAASKEAEANVDEAIDEVLAENEAMIETIAASEAAQEEQAVAE